MSSNFKHLFTGNSIIVQRISNALLKIGISPIIKDETESGRLAGFGAAIPGNQDLIVRDDEYEKAIAVVNEIKSETL